MAIRRMCHGRVWRPCWPSTGCARRGSELAVEARWYPSTAQDDLLEIEEGKIDDTRLYRCLDRILPDKRRRIR